MIRAPQRFLARLVALVRHKTISRELDDELGAHVDLLIERNRGRGLTAAEARRQALLRLGGLRATRELHRDVRGLPLLEQIFQSAWQAWRSLGGAKAVSLLASAALAVGIGAATSVYAVVNGAMLKPLPYPAGDRFVALFAGNVRNPERALRLRGDDAEKFLARTQSFDAFGWFRETGKNLTYGGEPHYVEGVGVTLSLAVKIGIEPQIGRWFEDESGVVLSNALWQRLGANPAIIGQGVSLDGQSYTVTGVMPESFRLPVAGMTSGAQRPDVWIPLSPRERAGQAYVGYGRRRPGVSFEVAEAEVRRVAADIAAEEPGSHARYTARLMPLGAAVVREVRPRLVLLLGAAGLLFLITCVNAAGLLLARSVARAPETALRMALGASRARLALQYLVEGLMISVAGAVGGVLLSLSIVPAIVSIAGDYIPRADEIALDGRVLLFAVAVATVAGVLCSLAPLWQASRTVPMDVLGSGVRSSAGARGRRGLQSLVIAEIAFAFALVTVSTVLTTHMRGLSRTAPGFDPEGVVTFVASLPGSVASDPAVRNPLQRRLVEALAGLPGVNSVAFTNQLPPKGCCWASAIRPDGVPAENSTPLRANLTSVSTDYFHVMRIALVGGRFLQESDEVTAPTVIPIVINHTARQRFWNDRDPVGAFGEFDEDPRRFQVMGVVADVRNESIGSPAVPEIYMPAFYGRVETMRFVVRSARTAASLTPDLRRAVVGVDPTLPIHDIVAMPDAIRNTIALDRTASFLTSFFAGAALFMAMLGVYGVVSYAVRQRMVEIGMRIALGATRGRVLSLIVGGGLTMASWGVTGGVFLAVAASAYLRDLLQIPDAGTTPFLSSAGVVALVAVAASCVPAWRAAVMSPLAAIRNRM